MGVKVPVGSSSLGSVASISTSVCYHDIRHQIIDHQPVPSFLGRNGLSTAALIETANTKRSSNKKKKHHKNNFNSHDRTLRMQSLLAEGSQCDSNTYFRIQFRYTAKQKLKNILYAISRHAYFYTFAKHGLGKQNINTVHIVRAEQYGTVAKA